MTEFVHRPFIQGETIAAIATPPGEGGVAIIRISGREALQIADKIFSGKVKTYASHSAHLGRVIDLQGQMIDEALLIVMKEGRSYTGEDVVELQCHGGMIASKKVLQAVLDAGARLADPGEFTLKAFMNGRLDLSQAEAVQQLIGAKNEKAYEAAARHLEGGLSKKVHALQKTLIDIAAILEAWVDFPEEGLEFATTQQLIATLQSCVEKMDALLNTFLEGRKIQQGINLCIAGCPNAGKSSLMNALLDKERAIVTPIAGTTRDTLEDDFTLNGLHYRLVDTAGIRHTTEVIEQEGIRRSRKAIVEADIILCVLDAAKGIEAEELALLEEIPSEKTLVVWNKVDLPHPPLPTLSFAYTVTLSAKEGWGMETLRESIDRLIWSKGAPPKDEVLLTSLRHFQGVQSAKNACLMVMEGLQTGISPEFLTFDLRQALFELGTIIGTNITEDILSSIFSQFCIGK